MMPTVTDGVVTCTAADWLAQADAILREHPVREVRLTTKMGWDEILKVWKRLGRPMVALPGLSFKEMVGLAWPGITFTLPEAHRPPDDEWYEIRPPLG